MRGTAAILDHVRLVWASLWSDRALLYRQELGLSPRESTIAVVVQELVQGRASGVAFSRSPTAADEAVVEAVWGLNQGLVDGTVQPDRWHLDRMSGELRRHLPAERREAVRVEAAGVGLAPLDEARRTRPPLERAEVAGLFEVLQSVAALFGAPQDVEWTLADRGLALLQARPVTTVEEDGDDKRRWYVSLHRSLGNLEALRQRIEAELLPGMERDAAAMAAVDLAALDDAALVEELRRRRAIRDGWVEAYWRDCIPFAHGMRLFGQIYNDRVGPQDPFEFVELLNDGQLLARSRDAELLQLAQELEQGGDAARLEALLQRYGLGGLAAAPGALRGLLSRLQERSTTARAVDAAGLRTRFLQRFDGEERERMAGLLELARASYRLRDDDNIYLGRVEDQLTAALREARRRRLEVRDAELHALLQQLEDPSLESSATPAADAAASRFSARARQLVGQPASPGLAVGPAQVIRGPQDLLEFREGHVLVCDAIDPTMTFVAPLAAGIVERRGGMLIHGAIIAREYGIPAVTGVPDATEWIRDGDPITVDGHLGIVTLG